MFFKKDGTPKVTGDGEAVAILEAEVVSEQGAFMGNLSDVIEEGMTELEIFLRKINVLNQSE